MSKKLLQTLILILISFLLSGCMQGYFLSENYQAVKPKIVLVLPPENTTAGKEVEETVYPIIYEKLSRRGYYCISPELARGIFNTNKLEDAGRIQTIPAKKMREIFGVDAILRVSVTDWTSKYFVISSTVNVGLKMELVNAHSGTTLWAWERTLSQSPNNSGGGLIGALVSAAVNAAFTPYEPIANENAQGMLSTVPEGVYFGQW